MHSGRRRVEVIRGVVGRGGVSDVMRMGVGRGHHGRVEYGGLISRKRTKYTSS